MGDGWKSRDLPGRCAPILPANVRPGARCWPKMRKTGRRHGVTERGRRLGASTCTSTTKACMVDGVTTAWRNYHDPLPDCHRCRLQEVPGVFHLPAEDRPRRCTEARRNCGRASSGREEVASVATAATRAAAVATPVCRAHRPARAGMPSQLRPASRPLAGMPCSFRKPRCRSAPDRESAHARRAFPRRC